LAMSHLAAEDLQRDEAGTADYSVLRRLLPSAVKILETDAVASLFDLADLLVTVPAVDGSGSLADVIVDSFEWVTNDRGSVPTRRGEVTGTSLALEMLKPYHQLVLRLVDAGAVGSLDRIWRHLTNTLRQTPDGTSLADPRMLPVLENLLYFTGEISDLPPEDRDCLFDSFQEQTEDFLSRPDFAAAVQLATSYADFPQHPVLDQLAVDLLQPEPALVKILSAALQIPDRDLRAQKILEFLAAVLDDSSAHAPGLLSTFDAILARDDQEAFLNVLKNLLRTYPALAYRAPLQVFAEMFAELASVQSQNLCLEQPDDLWHLGDAEAGIEAAVDFLTDDSYGLGGIYQLIAIRNRP